MSLTAFRTLGRSGLVISPLALGTMTFGTPRWGSPDEVSKTIFDAYVDAGGNFIDTADVYAKGRSEELVGGYIADRTLRDKLVLATKFSFNAEAGNPHAGGNNTQQRLHHGLIEKAKRLLLTTSLSVNETAFQLGFEYPQYFTRLFKNKTGVTPTAFRASAH